MRTPARAVGGAGHPGVPERPGARMRARRPPQLLLAGAQHRVEGRRPRARDRRADGLPARLRRQLWRGHADRADRRGRARAASPRANWPASCTAASPPRWPRCARPRSTSAPRPQRTNAWREGLRETEDEKRAGRAGRAQRRPLAAAPDARLQGAGRHPRPRRDRDRRRRRLRLLRRSRDEHLRAGLLARPGPVRLPRLRHRLRDRRQDRAARTSRSACCWATARSGSPAWSSTRWCATTCRSSP